MNYLEIQGRRIGPGEPVFMVAEMSANHHQSLDDAQQLIAQAAEVGADAVKLQTYTPDTITLDVRSDLFRRRHAKPGQPEFLYDLYKTAYTPWEWHAGIKAEVERRGMIFFSTPFDATAVALLEHLKTPAYKIASFELVDLPLIRQVARTEKPIIMSTGMASLAEIDDAVRAVREEGNQQIALLKCSSVYPAKPAELNLRTIPHMAETFGVPVGFSDHTLGIASAVAAVASGACIIEKHFCLSRAVPGPDSAFSLEPCEFKQMVAAVREAEESLGRVCYEPSESEKGMRLYRRSLFAVKDIKAGEVLTEINVRSIRPSNGLPPKHLAEVLGRRAGRAIQAGTPLNWELLG